MAFVSALVEQTVIGTLRMEIWSFVATGVTSGTVTTGLGAIRASILSNKTTPRGVIDDTTTAGAVALTGLTAGDAGYVIALGR